MTIKTRSLPRRHTLRCFMHGINVEPVSCLVDAWFAWWQSKLLFRLEICSKKIAGLQGSTLSNHRMTMVQIIPGLHHVIDMHQIRE